MYAFFLSRNAFFFQAEGGIRDWSVTGVQTCALPICQPFAPFTLTHTAGQGVEKCLASQGSELLTQPGRRSLRVIVRSISVARLCAFASFTEPFRWSSPLLHPTGDKPLQALNGCRQHVPFGFQVLNDPVEVHLMLPSGAGQHIRAAMANPAASECPAGLTGPRSPAATCLSSGASGSAPRWPARPAPVLRGACRRLVGNHTARCRRTPASTSCAALRLASAPRWLPAPTG